MKRAKSFILLVEDQQTALDFYIEKLGFEIHTDASFGEDNRWLTIRVPGDENFEVSLTPAKTEDSKRRIGNQSGDENALLGFITDDIEKNIADFEANGVELVGDLVDQPYGKFVFFKDLYGNRFYLHEEK